jgi:hypothetical protein
MSKVAISIVALYREKKEAKGIDFRTKRYCPVVNKTATKTEL